MGRSACDLPGCQGNLGDRGRLSTSLLACALSNRTAHYTPTSRFFHRLKHCCIGSLDHLQGLFSFLYSYIITIGVFSRSEHVTLSPIPLPFLAARSPNPLSLSYPQQMFLTSRPLSLLRHYHQWKSYNTHTASCSLYLVLNKHQVLDRTLNLVSSGQWNILSKNTKGHSSRVARLTSV